MATTASPTATPRTKACWVEHLTDRVLLEDIDESQWVFAGEWHGSHPVYQGQANADHRLYRSGSTWFYTKSGKFTKLAQAEHRDGTDPNIPPLGYGWIFCKDRSAVVGIQFSVVDSVDAMLKQIEGAMRAASRCLPAYLLLHKRSLSTLTVYQPPCNYLMRPSDVCSQCHCATRMHPPCTLQSLENR
jgi:hypothetical protein